MRRILCAVILIFNGLFNGLAGGEDSTRTPDIALDVLDTPKDLEASLVAAEPTLLSPSTIDVDHMGRIWVAEVVNYRRSANREREDRVKGDRILVLQDTDGDGVVDSSHTYYQGRDIDSAHGICVLGNRVIVSALDSVISFYDDNGDLSPDRREVMFTGVQGVQHDHGIHSFTFGPDGRLYFNFGNEGKELHGPDGSIVTDMAGNEVRANRHPYQEGMVFRCDPDGSNVETLGWNFRNNWELAIDSFGTIWQSDNDDDGNRATRINFVMEYGNYGYKEELTGASWKNPRTGMETTIPLQHWHLNDPGVVPNLILTGAGAPCGIDIYEGSLLPLRFHNQLLHSDAGVNVVRSYEVSADGAGFTASIHPVLSGTRDLWFRPCDVSVAADGSVIIADWYDPGVGGHRQGDIDRGRLFRIAPQGSNWHHPSFEFDTIDGAINGLLSCNRDARYLGWQTLANAGISAEPRLQKVFQENDNPRFRARALWLLGRLEGRTRHYLSLAATDRNPDIRIVALRLARQLQVHLPDMIQQLTDDKSPAVRRECAIALRNLPSDERAALWTPLAHSLPPDDRWFLEALGIGAQGVWDECLNRLTHDSSSAVISPEVMDAILWRSRSTRSAGLIAKTISSLAFDSETSPDQLARWFRALDFQQRDTVPAEALTLIRPSLLSSWRPTIASFVASEALARIRPGQLENGAAVKAAVDDALIFLDTRHRINVIERFQIEDRYPELAELVVSAPESPHRAAAVNSLLKLHQKQLLLEIIHGDSPEAAAAVFVGIGNARNLELTDELIAVVDDENADPDIRRAAVRSGLRILSIAKKIVARTRDGSLSSSLRQTVAAGLHGSSAAELRSVGQKLFPLPATKSGKQLPSIQDLMACKGDAKNGRLVYNTVGTCHKCHVVNRIGRNLGPNLSEIGSKLSRQALLESVLFPSAGISHNYDAWTILLVNGTTLTGLITSETDESILFVDNEAILHTVATDDIEEKIRQSVSLMPADLQKILTTQELVDVVAYMETLKKAAD